MRDAPDLRTSATLLGRLRDNPTDQVAWSEFVDRYGARIYGWCRRWNLQDADAKDVTQAVLATLCNKMKTFTYDPSLSFRGWLRTLTHHTWSDLVASRRPVLLGGGSGEGSDWLESLEARDDLIERLNEQFDRELLEEATVRVRLARRAAYLGGLPPHGHRADERRGRGRAAGDESRHRLQGQEQGAEDAPRGDRPARGDRPRGRLSLRSGRNPRMRTTCPSPDQLRRLLADQLGEIQETAIGEHVEGCPACQESLEHLTDATIQPERPASSHRDSRDSMEVDPEFLHDLKSDPPPGVLFGEDPAGTERGPSPSRRVPPGPRRRPAGPGRV